MNSTAFNEQSEAPNSEEKKSFGDYAKAAGSGIQAVFGKTASITGQVGMQALMVVTLWVVGALILNALNMGLGMGLLCGFLIFYTLSYIGNVAQGGTTNPIEHAKGLLH